MNTPEFVHIDLFSGIGGVALGFQKAGLNVKEHFFSEIDKNAINIYKNRFPKAKELGDVSFTLTTQDRHGIFDGYSIRKLTPLECERLQGFPDGWTEYGADGKKISDSACYKALGNAVSVPLPEIIGKRIALGE